MQNSSAAYSLHSRSGLFSVLGPVESKSLLEEASLVRVNCFFSNTLRRSQPFNSREAFFQKTSFVCMPQQVSKFG